MEDTENEVARPMRFNSVLQADVPKGRDGKHKEIVTQLLSDISQLDAGSALKIPLADLSDSKENIRAALSRAANQQNLHISNLTELVEIVEAEGRRSQMILTCGGPRVSNELAKELGYDAGFSKGTEPQHLASFIVRELVARADRPAAQSAEHQTQRSPA